MNMQRLLNTMFAVKVKAAIESGELSRGNIYQWVIDYNGIYDERLEEEVKALYRHFKKEKTA